MTTTLPFDSSRTGASLDPSSYMDTNRRRRQHQERRRHEKRQRVPVKDRGGIERGNIRRSTGWWSWFGLKGTDVLHRNEDIDGRIDSEHDVSVHKDGTAGEDKKGGGGEGGGGKKPRRKRRRKTGRRGVALVVVLSLLFVLVVLLCLAGFISASSRLSLSNRGMREGSRPSLLRGRSSAPNIDTVTSQIEKLHNDTLNQYYLDKDGQQHLKKPIFLVTTFRNRHAHYQKLIEVRFFLLTLALIEYTYVYVPVSNSECI